MGINQIRDIDMTMSEIQDYLDEDYSLERKGDGVWELKYDEDDLKVPVVTSNGNFSFRMQILSDKAGVIDHELGYAQAFKAQRSLENAGFLEAGELNVELPEPVIELMKGSVSGKSIYDSHSGVDDGMKQEVAAAVRDIDLGYVKARKLSESTRLTPKEVGRTMSALEEEYNIDSGDFRINKADLTWRVEILEEESFLEDYLEPE